MANDSISDIVRSPVKYSNTKKDIVNPTINQLSDLKNVL